jgi:hypothetical protein
LPNKSYFKKQLAGKKTKHEKDCCWLILIAVLTVAVISISYFTEASVYYWDQPYEYQQIDNQWFTLDTINNTANPGTYTTVHCQNRGLVDGTFNIIVKLTNATFSQNFTTPSELINGTEAKLSISLHAQRETFTDIYFTVNDNSTHFAISITFETNQLFIHSTEHNWAGQNEFPYSMGLNDTWSPAMIS